MTHLKKPSSKHGRVHFDQALSNLKHHREYITKLTAILFIKENAKFTISRYYEELCRGYFSCYTILII